TLTHLKNFNVAIWGNGWKRSKLVPKHWIKGAAIYGHEACHAMSRGVVNLNILREQNRDSHNMRTFEIPATASLMLTNRTAEQQRFFEEGIEILSYGSPEEMIDQIKLGINSRNEAKRMGERSYERVREETYAKRASEILHATGLA
ncbi:MAG TPA: glycosyltransferase, partial [Candidatus Kapabacteria bacterium]|nr:glycosyltransferase [Candidatus Kapabacteria bacterium]